MTVEREGHTNSHIVMRETSVQERDQVGPFLIISKHSNNSFLSLGDLFLGFEAALSIWPFNSPAQLPICTARTLVSRDWKTEVYFGHN